ncbi:MAG: GNAT family N-acetyltransferase [Pseudomonadales bacterium]
MVQVEFYQGAIEIGADDLESLKAIFFEASNRQEFSDEKEKKAFYETWTGYYLDVGGDSDVLLLKEAGEVQGYLMGTAQSEGALDFYRYRVPSYAIFNDMFADYPAHLHLNLSSEARNRGLGSYLMETYCEKLRADSIPGVHVVTSPDSRNSVFYQRAGFTHLEQRSLVGHSYLFLGKQFGVRQ